MRSKRIIKQWRPTAFGPGTGNECAVQWWFKKLCKRDKSVENEKCSGRPPGVDNDQLKPITEADPLTTTQEVAIELSVDHSMVVQHLKPIGKMKKLNTWVPHKLTQKKKKSSF